MRRLALVAALGAVLLVGSPAARPRSGAHPAPVVVPPVVVHHVDAVYPPSALEARKHADVVLTVTVDADGHVSKVDVAESGGADLDEAAIVAAREWTFVAATRDGKPIASRIKMPFHFAPPAAPPEVVEAPTSPGDVPVHEAVPSAPAAPAAPPRRGRRSAGHGRSRAPSRGPSDFEIPIGQLAVIPHTNAADFLKLAPGIMVTNEGGEGHADSIVLRGSTRAKARRWASRSAACRSTSRATSTATATPIRTSFCRSSSSPCACSRALRSSTGELRRRRSAEYELGLAQRGLGQKGHSAATAPTAWSSSGARERGAPHLRSRRVRPIQRLRHEPRVPERLCACAV